VSLKNDIEDAIEQFAALSEVMDEVTGEPQPTSNIKQALEVSLAAVKHVAADKLEAAQTALDKANAEPEEELVEDAIQADSEQPKKLSSDEINSRENAIKKLQEIATFFRKTEPHSPMSYTIEQVIRWSELSLPELLNELITDSDARTGYFKLSGIKISETET